LIISTAISSDDLAQPEALTVPPADFNLGDDKQKYTSNLFPGFVKCPG
jgi:hypothetical protein